MDKKVKQMLESNISQLLCGLKNDNLFTLQDITEAYIDMFSKKNEVSKGEVVQILYKYMRTKKESQYFSEYLIDWFPELLCREDKERPTYREVSIYYDLYGEDSRPAMERTIRQYCKKYNVPLKQVVDELNLRMKERKPGYKSKNLEEWFPDVFGTER